MTDAGTAPPARPLDEVMLAMDVVDTLRHRQTLVAQELAGPESDEALLERLRQIYASQGIEVPDRILREGVTALREDRFAHTPPRDPPLWARIYVQRGLWMRRALVLVVLALVAWAVYALAIVAPRQALAEDIAGDRAAIVAMNPPPDVQAQADALHERAGAAYESGDFAAARAEGEELEELRARLETSYDLMIVTGPTAVSGVWRVPEANEAARNYYLIVEAIGDDGTRLTLPIRNEETGEVERVSTFGLGVTEDTWDRVGRDLEEDGVIQERRVAVKRPGELEPEYLVSTTGGAITEW